MLDLVIRHARLDGMDGLHDIGIRAGRIACIEPDIQTDARALDAAKGLVFKGFADSHIHLDKACLLDRTANPAGTLQGAIDAVSAAKRSFTAEDVYARGARVLEKAIAQGTSLMRTQVEIDPGIGLIGFDAVRRLRADFAWGIDLQICVFPQEGLLNYPGTETLLQQALEAGADLLGGCPYTDTDPEGHIQRIFALARRYDVDIDFHLDFDLDPSWRHLDWVARETIANGMEGRVTIGHVTKLSMLPPASLAETFALMQDAGLALTVLPATDLFMTGRDHTHGVPRGVAPAQKAQDAGLCCTLATNNVLNPFTPYGDCSLTRIANLFANIAQLGTAQDLTQCFDMVADAPYRLIGRDPALRVGGDADLVALPVASRAAAVAEIARPIWGIKSGRLSFDAPAPKLLSPQSEPR